MNIDVLISKIECYAVYYQALTNTEKSGKRGMMILQKIHFYSELVEQLTNNKFSNEINFIFELN